jgi:4-hydroxythreonine-4-phosphate dehydrogenase
MTLDDLLFSLDLIRKGTLDGFVFAPLNKEALMRAGMREHSELELFKNEFPGHAGLEEINILDGAWALRVTSHIPLKDIVANLSVDKVLASLRFLSAAMRANGTTTARIAVAALNPHGGENGLCGTEELDIIAPAIKLARSEGIDADGPFPADTVFLKVRSGEYQGILNMYHDQGQIATKLIGLSRGVTFHAGFPVPISTPAHGSAFDIVEKGVADLGATKAAWDVTYRIAAENVRHRRG